MIWFCLTVFCTYAVGLLVSALRSGTWSRKMLIPAAVILICGAASGYLYYNGPDGRYAGHGFDYMHGYSSTDYSDYMVYKENSGW